MNSQGLEGGSRFLTKATLKSWILLALLSISYLLAIMDRMIVALLIEPIKADMQLTDTEIGLIQGLAFALFYTTLAIPIGRLIDRGNRTSLLAVGIAVWGIATSACGLASKAWHLFVSRLAVGLGEASLMPAAYSLIPDSFPRKSLGMASGIYAIGGTLGVGASLYMGGMIYDWFTQHGPVTLGWAGTLSAWQMTFIVIGLPGLVVALLLWGFREPERLGPTSAAPPSWAEVGEFAAANKRWIVPLFLAVSLSAGMIFLSSTWVVSFLVRSYGLGVVEASSLTGPVHMAASALSALVFGPISDVFARSGGHRRLYLCAAALAVCTIGGLTYPIVSTLAASLALWGLTIACASVPIAAAAANLQEFVPGRSRGVITGAYLLVINLIGYVGGSVLVAVVADQFFPQSDGLRYALAWVGTPTCIVSAILFATAGLQQRALSKRNG